MDSLINLKELISSLSIILLTTLTFSCNNAGDQPIARAVLPPFEANPKTVLEQTVSTLKIGDKAPEFLLPGTDGKYHRSSDYDDSKILVVIFTCNHCPTAQAYEDRIISLSKEYASKGVQLIAISPNSPLGLLYEELGYSDLGDSYEDMIVRANDKQFPFPYLYDGDDQKVSLAYGPIATPHSFVFDEERKLQYVGRLDKSEKPGTANAEDLRNAIDNLLVNQPIQEPTTKTFGCSTKWGWKTKMRKRVDKEWAAREVSLDVASIANIKNIMSNATDKLRLVNVWATWCGPCRIEFPEFIAIQRMFGARDFEFISLSSDKLSKKAQALQFLQSVNSAVPNYISEDDDNYALVEAIDSSWEGALPYTALIEPGGKIIWSHQGEVNFHELKKTIVEHHKIGRVY